MDFLNSQHLTPQDGFAHPFRRPGEFTYWALPSDSQKSVEMGIIIVSGESAPGGKGKQFDVLLRWDAAARRFVRRGPDTKLALRPNDFVMFQFEAGVPGQPPCAIVARQQDAVECDSRRMRTHDAFIHFFVQPGDYTYRLGGSQYRISVEDHRSMPEQEHQRQVAQPLVIMVDGQEVRVPHGRVVAGQSVIWAIERGDEVHIEGVPSKN
jgi:hypothetical protein